MTDKTSVVLDPHGEEEFAAPGAADNSDHEPTVAELEAAARAKVSAKNEADAPASNSKVGTPEVNKLKPHRQNRLVFVMVAVLVVLIVMAWGGDWIYRNFLKSAPASPEAASLSSSSAPAQRRSGMGAEIKPFFVDESEAIVLPEIPAEGEQPSRLTPPSFNKTRALVSRGTVTAPASGTALSRVSERTLSTGSGTPATASTTPAVGNVGVTSIPFDPDLYIPEGRYIPCSLGTRFVSDVAGRISCNISEDIYSASGHTKLIEKGTTAKGVYKTGTLKAGQSRMFIVWTELRTPDAKKIPLVDTQVVGQLGEAGIDGWIDTHFWERFGNTLLLSTVSDVAAVAATGGTDRNRNTDYTENTRAASVEMAKIALENNIGIPPTIYKNQGDIIGMIVGEDIDFSNIYTLRMKQG